jgi:ABC-type phosphate/phosphonate transport system substrate-binding protein
MTLILAACGSQQAQQQQSGIRTATPISTPLPVVPTAIPPGVEGNPIRIVIRPVNTLTREERDAAVDVLTTLIKDKTKLDIEVVTVIRYAEALAALCESGSGQVSAAWLDGVTYTAALAQNCGIPTLQVRRDTNRENDTGEAGQIIVNGDLGSTELSLVTGRTFCRIGYDDFYSWLLPVLVARSQRIDLLSVPSDVVDYEDVPSLVKAVADGDCAAAGISEDAFTRYEDELTEVVREGIRISVTSIAFPYDILMYPIEVQLGVRLSLNDALVEIAEDAETSEILRTLLGQDELAEVEPNDLAALTEFMNSTGFDFAQMGN